jgi:zinc transporter ZupT
VTQCLPLADNFIYGLLPVVLRRKSKNLKENSMNKLISMSILAGGIVLVVSGVAATESFSSDISRFFTGSPTDKAIWTLLGGIVVTIIGLAGLVRGQAK